jgi:N-acetylmuramoyl-L-alanine amidase
MIKRFRFLIALVVFSFCWYGFKAETTSLEPPNSSFKIEPKVIIKSDYKAVCMDEIGLSDYTSEEKITDKEYQLLVRVCMSEAGNQPLEGKIAVVETVLNRVEMGKGSIEEVITAKRQYSTADNGEPNDECYEAVDKALSNNMYPDTMIYFRTEHFHTFGIPYEKIGDHYFSLEEEN